MKDGLTDAYDHIHMGNCAEKTAADYGISRQDQDNYAIESYKKSAEAWKVGYIFFFFSVLIFALTSELARILQKMPKKHTGVSFFLFLTQNSCLKKLKILKLKLKMEPYGAVLKERRCHVLGTRCFRTVFINLKWCQ